MTAVVLQLPTARANADRDGPTMSEQEIVDLCGGYVQPKRQLRALHDLGFTRAYIARVGRTRVVLERTHAEAVQRGQFGPAQQPADPAARPQLPPNRAGYRAKFTAGRKA